MASKAIVPLQQRGGEGKQKNGKAEGRNRRVLKDIGNLVNVPAIEVGKPQTRPMTRNFGKQQVVKAQEEAEGKIAKKQQHAQVVNGGLPAQIVVPTKPTVQKKETHKQKPIVVEERETPTPMSISGRNSRLGSSSKRTLTSILTARSKFACDIDASDIENELAVVEYVDDIYKFYKLTEGEGSVHDYMGSQPDINSKMRAILVDWLIEVHRKFELRPETLYLTINIVDRFLSVKAVPRKELQLVGISSMLIACKYEEIWAPEVSDFIAISDDSYVREEILLMEKAILGKLEWYLTVPTPYVFLVRYIKASLPSDQEMKNMAFFLTELGLMHYPVIISCCPSMIAASAVYAARCTLNKSPIWTETLEHHSYSENQIKDCAKILMSCHATVGESKLKAVYRKYQDPEKGAVALYAPAKSLVAASY